MPPVHQRIAPVAMRLVLGRTTLRQVAVHISDDLLHVREVVGVEIGLLLSLECDDATARSVANRLAFALAVRALPANAAAVVRLEMLFEGGGRHVRGLLKGPHNLPSLVPIVHYFAIARASSRCLDTTVLVF